MKFLKSYTTKVGKKNRDPKAPTADGICSASVHTSAITSSLIKSPQPDATSLLSETLVYRPPTAVTPGPDFAARPSFSTSFTKPVAATAATAAQLDHPSRTLLVMRAKAPPGGDKEKDEKMEAASSYMYGPKVNEGYEGEKKVSSSHSDMQPPRTNRAQALRQERNATRINEEKMIREQLLKQRIMRAASDTTTTGGSSTISSDSEDGDSHAGEPIHARVIPRSLYHKPKITVRETLSSKFRYLFNRKPAGVSVYFKQADDNDPKKKPPFVLASKQHCF